MRLTVQQAATRAGVCVNLVYNWCQSRRLAHYRLGGEGRRGRILIDDSDLEAFLQACLIEPAVAVSPSTAPHDRKPTLKHIRFS